MGVLGFCVKNLDTAVHVPVGDVNSLFPQKIDQYRLSHASQIPGDDPVIFFRGHMKIFHVTGNGVCSGRGHACSHVHGVFQAVIHDPSGSHAGNVGSALLI